MYDKLAKIQRMLWENDDLMTQETLFKLQDYVQGLVLDVAQREGRVDDALRDFKYLYYVEGEEG